MTHGVLDWYRLVLVQLQKGMFAKQRVTSSPKRNTARILFWTWMILICDGEIGNGANKPKRTAMFHQKFICLAFGLRHPWRKKENVSLRQMIPAMTCQHAYLQVYFDILATIASDICVPGIFSDMFPYVSSIFFGMCCRKLCSIWIDTYFFYTYCQTDILAPYVLITYFEILSGICSGILIETYFDILSTINYNDHFAFDPVYLVIFCLT